MIAGGLVELGPLLFDPLHGVVPASRRRCGVPAERSRSCPAELGERAGAVGAAVLARELLT